MPTDDGKDDKDEEEENSEDDASTDRAIPQHFAASPRDSFDGRVPKKHRGHSLSQASN